MDNLSKTFGKLTIPLLVLLTISFSALPAQAKYGGGTGEPNDPYLIATAEDLNSISLDPNDWDKHFKMTADINMAGYTYTTALIAPDTDNTNWDFDGTPFTGTFNGSNHTIHNLTIDTAGANNNDYLGLFGQLRSSIVVSNLRLENANITGGNHYVGGLCGSNGDWGYPGGIISDCYFNGSVTCGDISYAVGGLVGFSEYGTISNCYTTGSVSGGDYIGGLVGHNNYGTIFNCYNSNGYVVGGDSSYAVGGLVGYNEYGTVSNCHSNGYVTGGENSYAVGGLVGEHYEGSISNCYVTGSVNADEALGSLVGRIYYGSVSNCYSAGTVTGESYTIGGLVGYNYNGTINNCYAADSVSGGDNSARLGGLVGWNYGTITNCYAVGSITGGIGSSHLGGLVGKNQLTITKCYAAGTVSSGTGSSNLAGLCGYQNGYYAEISNCFWDTESTSMSIGCNFGLTYPGPGTTTNVFGKTTAEMQLQSTFTDYGWDFDTPIWTIDEGADYPRLWWEIVPVLHAELEVTLGTSNTITWDPVPGANDYYAECAEDANFTSIVYNSGWITEISCEFIGLQLGQRYWYSVKARNSAGVETGWSNVESSLQGTLLDAVAVMLDPDTLKNKNIKNALLNKINAVQQMLDAGRYEEALNKLQNDVLAKMNGCAETGEPDKNDWIITCEGQSVLYPLVIETIENVKGLMD